MLHGSQEGSHDTVGNGRNRPTKPSNNRSEDRAQISLSLVNLNLLFNAQGVVLHLKGLVESFQAHAEHSFDGGVSILCAVLNKTVQGFVNGCADVRINVGTDGDFFR